ncbi:MAG: glycosyltransferase family 39 protein, partial [Candidatus Bathyarchaeota archaeon]|nr:glycosyltransferase family 39 protein [Candidatus Bathyarchaeota archaeon]
MVKIRKLFSKEKVANSFKSVGALRFKASHSSLMHISLLLLILFIALMVRLLPIRWGFHLSEFDPHFQYRLTKHMVENGFFAWASWRDPMRWYPAGYPVRVAYPGLPATAAFFYIVVSALGLSPSPMFTSNPLTVDPLFNFCVIFPAIMGALTCLVIYFLGRDIGGKEVGLFSAFFLALNSSYIGRTSLGFFDDETVGIFGILLFIFFFLRSIEPERSLRNGLTYGIASGLSLGYLFSSWGASRYALGMAVLFVFVLILLQRYSSRLLLSYSAAFGVALFIAINIPILGFGYLTETTVLAVFGIFLLLCMYEASRYIKTPKMKMAFVLCFLALIAVSFFMLSWLGYLGPLGAKFWSVINPFERLGEQPGQQLVQSVQEHRPAAWGSFYYDIGIGLFFVPVGLFFAVQNPTNRNIFLCIFGITSVYFAGSMVRLTLLMAPAFSLLWALALVQLLGPFITLIKETPLIPRRKIRFETHVGREFSGAFIVLMFVLLTFTFVLPSPLSTFPRALDHAYSPTTIAAGSLPVRPVDPVPDWIDALNWMRVNLKSTDVVASWWDYGYWITFIANKTSLADNGTINTTQIARIGQMFLSNETEAIKILSNYDATYIVVFTTFDQNGNEVGWADEGKWRWMARIGGLDDDSFGNYTLGADWVDINGDGSQSSDELVPNEKGNSTVIYKLMQYGKEVTLQGYSTILLEHFEEAYFSQTAGQVRQYGGAVPLVCVYKIKYDVTLAINVEGSGSVSLNNTG